MRSGNMMAHYSETTEIALDLGGGREPQPGHLNVDLRGAEHVDIVATATDLPFEADSVDRIHANSLIPHIDDLNQAMDEWWRVLKPGGELELAATHAHSTGIVADPDHHSWSWTSETPGWYDHRSSWDYYSKSRFELLDVKVVGWFRPYRWWLRPLSYVYGEIIQSVEADVADELMKFPFAGGRVRARWKKVD